MLVPLDEWEVSMLEASTSCGSDKEDPFNVD